MSSPTTMPAAFIGHGSPMNALDPTNRYVDRWRAFGASVPRPRAIVVISAHWYINGTAVTAMAAPRTIHDFFGFPPELFAVRYPAPGDPDLAAEIAELAAPVWVGLDHDSWGFDHGAWSVLVHAFPDASVPVLQLSIDATKPLADHVALGARLAPLRERDVLILGSGNIVHNLGRLDPGRPEEGFPSSVAFDDEAERLMTTDPASIASLGEHPAYSAAVPTPEHLLPLMYIAGLAAAAGTPADLLVKGYAFGSLSMTSYIVGGADVTRRSS